MGCFISLGCFNLCIRYLAVIVAGTHEAPRRRNIVGQQTCHRIVLHSGYKGLWLLDYCATGALRKLDSSVHKPQTVYTFSFIRESYYPKRCGIGVILSQKV